MPATGRSMLVVLARPLAPRRPAALSPTSTTRMSSVTKQTDSEKKTRPVAVWRDGSGAVQAADMMDNARALPQAPAPNTSDRQHDIRRSERSRFQLRNRFQWSYRRGPLKGPGASQNFIKR